MSTLQHLREGLSDTWESLLEGWQRLYKRASGAITKFSPAKKDSEEKKQEIAVRSSGWGVLASELFDDGDKLIVRVEAPGMEKEDFDIQVVDNHLVIRGEKRYEKEDSKGSYYISERAYGMFQRAIPLNLEVKADQAEASYKDGVLRIDLPKVDTTRSKRISVEVK